MPVKTIRAVTLAILFLVALALAFLSFALLLLAVVLCIFFALLAFLAAPEETKAFVRGSRDTVDWLGSAPMDEGSSKDAGRDDGGVDGEICGGASQAAEESRGAQEPGGGGAGGGSAEGGTKGRTLRRWWRKRRNPPSKAEAGALSPSS